MREWFMKRRGQISLEFMLVFGILMVLMLYSVNNVTFAPGSTSIENLRIQISLEEKNLANSISNAISQVYAQGPGSKTTAYVRLVYLRNPEYMERTFNVVSPRILITYGPFGNIGNGTFVTVVNGTGSTYVTLSGGDKTMFWSRSLYDANLISNSSVWRIDGSTSGTQASLNMEGTPATVYGILLTPGNSLPAEIKIVVEWNPNLPDSWNYNTTSGEIRINISPGELG